MGKFTKAYYKYCIVPLCEANIKTDKIYGNLSNICFTLLSSADVKSQLFAKYVVIPNT